MVMSTTKPWRLSAMVVFLLSIWSSSLLAQMTTIGSFEGTLPSYWNKGSEPAGATLTWATDQARSLSHSLKITKTATSDVAMWQSDNMVDYWSQRDYANVDILVGAWIKTSGVNTNPANDDARWWIAYTFYDSAGTLIGTTKLPINQSVASSTGWVADTNAVGETILPKDAWKTIVTFVGGKNATGTVWADDFILTGRAGAWAGNLWNDCVDFPTGWIYWLPTDGGNTLNITNGFDNTRVTNETSHSGLYSLKFAMPANRQPHDGFVGTKRFPLNLVGVDGVKPGDVLRATVWIKASNLVPDSAAKYPDTWSVGFTYGFFKGNGNNDGFNNVDGYPKDMSFVFPAVTSFDWTPYTLDIVVPNTTDAKALEIRLHVYSAFTGTVYFDDLSVEKLDVPEIATAGSFEGQTPSYWNKGNEPAGATLTWATDQARSLTHSLKITKTATSDVAMWQSDNMVDYWSQRDYANVDILLGAWIKTSGVNTNPANDDARWYIAYTFYDSAGTLIGTTKLPIDQSVASSTGWVADTNAVGETILPKDAWKTIVTFVGGKNATGTVWADDFILTGRAGAWAGNLWNDCVDFPTGWIYWLPTDAGNTLNILNGFANTAVTKEAAHGGLYSLKFNMPADRQPHDGFVGTKRALLNPAAAGKSNDPTFKLDNVQPGDWLRAKVWIKAANLVPDSAAKYPDTWSVGFTYGFFKGNDNNAGFNNVDGYPKDMSFVFPAVNSFDWTPYSLDFQVPATTDAKALEIRLHVYSAFVGTVYFDDLTVEKLEVPEIASNGSFEATLPSYWNKGNEPAGATLTWATDQARSLTHSLKITKTATSDVAMWQSDNMVDYWSQRDYANVDILVGAWIKTSGVNTNPANDDARWYIAYSFYDSTGVLIGTTKLPINQTVATSTGWVADTNAVGETILPKDAWKTIVTFVGGKNATGTVWADDFILTGRAGAWAGNLWNDCVDFPTGWIYWLPTDAGNTLNILNGFANTAVTKEAAHSGLYSLKFDMPVGRQPHDGFVGTKRALLNPASLSAKKTPGQVLNLDGVNPGDVLRASVWIKAANLVPDSAAKYPDTWSVGFTYGFFKGNDNNAGFNNVDGYPKDMSFVFPAVTSFDWTQYNLDFQVPATTDAKALEIRLHVYSAFTGKVYFDDLQITNLRTTTGVKYAQLIPKEFTVFQNYPNPFNPTTQISYSIPENSRVVVKVYDMIGREVATVVNEEQTAGMHQATWNGLSTNGTHVSSGAYIYSVQAGEHRSFKKMMLLK